MEMDPGKLFIGGISWDTNEERLKDYFQCFGHVIEAVIMKDRTTGRARGFGFVVFSDPAVAQSVVKHKHIIDGRTVEAKKAVPRDDQQVFNNRTNGSNSSSIQGSPGPTRTKKIFVGGLASTVTETDFKNYFDQFGSTTDVVVMYDHNTQRPRGFGFITYDSEESVDRVLQKTFHEINGKMVEVKRAVPKESSHSPNRSNISGYNYGLRNASSYINDYVHGFSPSSLGRYGVRIDGRFSPFSLGQDSYSPFGPLTHDSIGPNSDSVLGFNNGGNRNGNFSSNIGFGRTVDPTYSRFTGIIGYGGTGEDSNDVLLKPTNNDIWGIGNKSYTNGLKNSSNDGFGSFGAIWGDYGYDESGGSKFIGGSNGLNAIGYGRKNGNSVASASSSFGDFGVNGESSFYTDPTWSSLSPDIEVSGLFSYGIGGGRDLDGVQKKTDGYSVANSSNRGIAA
ncbi:uncharacterized protein [Rutidosis leptorrhynchoides]|uniref:uncharacterized protein n=1 Tax=Rutidosis leptorrhynchoides TaxID=125765 RepID=UPI003A994579